ncbi:UDP-N-acetylglucosamine 2-epimerase [Aminobacterium colombiense DSM 12261]|uniref:UDP-N-acetylglucosamine 2-epimerase n=2 Tax=Aminobacterium TaxID=81466 RepID=D5EH03_AMICL|nr:UDP-N-acetylglucosamine 2-epimerase [Aminobacterium colombiense DSM 12261]
MENTIISLVGARPQFIKEAVIASEVHKTNAWNHILVHSGQHYDVNMSDLFFEELQIPTPKYFLEVGSSSHGKQTAAVLEKFEDILLQEKPDLVLVYGDTNTTVAGALAAAKLNIPVAHIEAGMRQYPKNMPEEVNRVVTDHLSSLLFCCSELSYQNLQRENITSGVYIAGDVMYDLFLRMKPRFLKDKMLQNLTLHEGEYILVTLHRDFNVDNKESLLPILEGLNDYAKMTGLSIVFPMHPRTRKRIEEFDLATYLDSMNIVEPVGYLELMGLLEGCSNVVTDSGGLQKEAYYAKKQAAVIMPDTGWKEIIESGWNQLVPGNAAKELLPRILENKFIAYPVNLYGDGNAAKAIVKNIMTYLNK